MKYLVTLKPVTHGSNYSTYSVLLEINWNTKKIIRSLKIPAANYNCKNSYMRSFAQGCCKQGKYIYVSNWNFVSVVDYDSFEIVDAFSHPLMADNHGIDTSEDEIFVCSTSIDALLCFDLKSYQLKWFWRPDETPLDNKFFVPSFFAAIKKREFYLGKIAQRLKLAQKIKIPFNVSEFRSQDKKKSPYHNHHLNEVIYYKNSLYILTKGWNNTLSSSIIRLYPETKEAAFISPPGSYCGAHDLLTDNDRIIITESGSECVGFLSNDNVVSHTKITNHESFIRGIASTNDGFLVGFSYNRKKTRGPKQSVIREYDKNFNQVNYELNFDTFYPDSIGSAIHNIYRADD